MHYWVASCHTGALFLERSQKKNGNLKIPEMFLQAFWVAAKETAHTHDDTHQKLIIFFFVVSTHLKNISQNWIISPGRDENRICLKPPPSLVGNSLQNSALKRHPLFSWGGSFGSQHSEHSTREVRGNFTLGRELQFTWGGPKIGVPQNGWFIMENAINMHDLGVPLFPETSTFKGTGTAHGKV